MVPKGSSEFLLVKAPDSRTVIVDGTASGHANSVLLVSPGSHLISLDPSEGVSPARQDVVVSGTTETTPLLVTFAVADASPGQLGRPNGVTPPDRVPISAVMGMRLSRTVRASVEAAKGILGSVGPGISMSPTLLL